MKPPSPDAIFLPAAEPGFVLSEESRRQVPEGVDLAVMERAMARIRPEFRARFLDDLRQFHEESRADGKAAYGPMTIRVGDPEIESLFRQLFRSF